MQDFMEHMSFRDSGVVSLDDPEVQHELAVYGISFSIRKSAGIKCMEVSHDQIWEAYRDLVPVRGELRLGSSESTAEEGSRLSPIVEEAVAEANLRSYIAGTPPSIPDVASYDTLSVDGVRTYAEDVVASTGVSAKVVVGRNRRHDRRIIVGGDNVLMQVAADGHGRPVRLIITSSARLTMSPDQMRLAILHEIAHIMVWPEFPHHHERWKRAVRFVGGDPELVTADVGPAPISVFRCLCCGTPVRYYQFKLLAPRCECGEKMRRVR